MLTVYSNKNDNVLYMKSLQTVLETLLIISYYSLPMTEISILALTVSKK